jgi:rod shape-determining protein MreC
VVPKPLPTIHSDRYSPGATPSAADLKPGAAETTNSTAPQTPTPDATTHPPTSKPAQPKPRQPQPPADSTQPPNPQP